MSVNETTGEIFVYCLLNRVVYKLKFSFLQRVISKQSPRYWPAKHFLTIVYKGQSVYWHLTVLKRKFVLHLVFLMKSDNR